MCIKENEEQELTFSQEQEHAFQSLLDVLEQKPLPYVTETSTIGIFGQRGAGKTTFIRAATEKLKNKNDQKSYKIPDLLDCTQVPPHIEPGCAVLLHLMSFVDDPTTKQKLSDLANRYSLSTKEYRELCLDLSSSASEFNKYQTDGASKRLSLKQDIKDLLDNMASQTSFESFIIGLDDFDLVPKDLAFQWVKALLDDLDQERLIFLVAADFYRMQYLLVHEGGYDEKTSRAILNKIIPPSRRINLSRWSPKAPLIYPTLEENSVTLLNELLANAGIPLTLLLQLLPRHPRGLYSLHDGLKRMQREQIKHPLPKGQKITRILELIANAREETMLSRELCETRLTDWPKILDPQGVEDTTWDDLRDQAKERSSTYILLNKQDDLDNYNEEDLLLECLSCMVPHDHQSPGAKKEASLESRPFQMTHNPEWGYPIRFDHLKNFSLKDAAAPKIPFWTELLLNLGFKSDDFPLKALKNRIYFWKNWKPIGKRQNDAYFSIEAAPEQVQTFFDTKSLIPEKAALLWINHNWKEHDSDQGSFNMGWSRLFESLCGIEDPLHHKWRAALVVSDRPLAGKLPELRTIDTLAMLPDEIWAMILLAEGLNRCPWLTFSRKSTWRLQAHLCLAASMVRSAYVYALIDAKIIQEDELGKDPKAGEEETDTYKQFKQQRLLYDVLRLRDPMDLISAGETRLIDRSAELFNDGIEKLVADKTDSLSKAFKAYLDSEPYLAVVRMNKQLIKVRDLRAKLKKKPAP